MLALLSYAILLVSVLRRAVRSRLYRFFALYLLVMAVWSFGSAMMRLDPDRILLWNKVMSSGAIVMPLAFFGFVQMFLDEKRDRWLWVGIVSLFGLEAANALGLMVTGARLLEGGLVSFDTGPATYTMAIYGPFFLSFSVWCLVRAHHRASDPVLRNRIRYPLIGAVIVLLGALSNLVEVLGYYPVDHAANLLNALLLAYAILRYRLLDIAVVVRKGLLYFIPTAIVGAGYFLLISLAMRLFHASAEPQILLVSFLVAVMTAVVAQPLRDRAQLGIDKLFFREKYDSSLMLQRLSHTAASVLDFDKLMDMLLRESTTTMHIKGAAILLRGENGEFHLMAQRGPEQNPDLRLRKDHPIVGWLSSHENALTRHDMDVTPQFKALWGKEREDLERMGAEFFIPLKAKGELVGILAVGSKLSEESYSQDDQLTLTTLANQAAVAIENARLYDVAQQELAERKRAEETLKEYSGRLEEMVEQRTHELQRAYSDLRDSQAKLIQSEKLAATGRLAASVAHEINNPLQGISNYLSVISQQVAEDDPLHEDLEMVKLGFERIAEIVRRLRAFYRPAEETMGPTDINGAVKRVLALLGHQLSLGQVEVKTELAEQELLVLGSAGQLEQVLVNLVLNAQEAMPQGGGVIVRTTLRDNMVQLQMSDTGHGISEEEMSRLFEPFYSGKGGKGLGLGLWISHNIIEGHGGHIEVESQVGHGTTFTISLPAYQRER